MSTFSPQKLETPGTKAGDQFNQVLREAQLPGSSKKGAQSLAGQDFGTWLTNTFQLPGYEGPMTAGANQYQTGAANDFMNLSPQMYQNILSSQTGLADIASGDYTDKVYSALDDKRRLGLARDLNDTREQFSSAGLRNSTAYANAMGMRQSESEAGLTAAMAEILPQLLNARTAAASQVSGLSGAAGDVAKTQYGLGEGLRGIEDTDLQRRFQDFIRQSGLFETLIPLLMGQKVDYGPSPFSQVGNTLVGAGSVAASFAK